jgi:hypothetical protein
MSRQRRRRRNAVVGSIKGIIVFGQDIRAGLDGDLWYPCSWGILRVETLSTPFKISFPMILCPLQSFDQVEVHQVGDSIIPSLSLDQLFDSERQIWENQLTQGLVHRQ